MQTVSNTGQAPGNLKIVQIPNLHKHSRTPYGKHSTFYTSTAPPNGVDEMWIQTHANYMSHEISTLLSVL